ncbi:hypothetical protein LguiB_022918 [Lonicera macranthoides]
MKERNAQLPNEPTGLRSVPTHHIFLNRSAIFLHLLNSNTGTTAPSTPPVLHEFVRPDIPRRLQLLFSLLW